MLVEIRVNSRATILTNNLTALIHNLPQLIAATIRTAPLEIQTAIGLLPFQRKLIRILVGRGGGGIRLTGLVIGTLIFLIDHIINPKIMWLQLLLVIN